MSLKIHTFGRLSIERDGEVVAGLASSKAEALLVYLACTGREQPREVLADLLWNDRTQRQALANLRVVLSSLRRVLGPYVDITRTTAAPNPRADTWLDVRRLQEASEQAQDGIRSPAEAEALGAALEAYVGDFLAGSFLPEASGFENWVAGERERLHRQLMEALAHNGQRAEALRQYETCRRVLAEELGVEPDAETHKLADTIRAGAPEPVPVTPAATPPAPLKLPTPLTPLIGREQEVAEIQSLLLDRSSRLISIVAPGGMGKTRLAMEVARHLDGHFADGVAFVSLAPLQSAEGIVPALASALRFKPSGAAGEPRDAHHWFGTAE